MIKNYTQRFYPNPFRYRGFKNTNNEYEIFEQLKDTLKPFLENKFSGIDEYFDEFFNPKSEIFIVRLVRNSIKDKYDLIIEKAKSNFFMKRFIKYFIKYIDEFESIENYQKNLRYLELPVQPLVDKKGFEIQSVSNDIVENILEDIDSGMNYIYDYCADKLPESIDLWEDYALLYPNEFPVICHDHLLEITYRSLDRTFNKIQKGIIDNSKWVVSGDLNSRIMKIIKPKYDIKDFNNFFGGILESLISLIILILLARYLIYYFKPILGAQKRKLLALSPFKMIRKAKKTLNFNRFRVKQKVRQLKLKINKINFKLNLKYKLLQLIFNRNILQKTN
uniref:Uncharacterized protein n=1 Tax=Eustigmatophyceae sp. Chic 10/23 P-6w TaxID=1446905 RepID=A0A451FMC5_9STRA|nr:hypothetical protein [Eustigmatophyceae sp. Chic 10/23 P-6w]QAA11551.1 hypothetical protein [Eustigmatophyceae sp. Chic 10/23 P-6w]